MARIAINKTGRSIPTPLKLVSRRLRPIVPMIILNKPTVPQIIVNALAIPAAGPIKLMTEDGWVNTLTKPLINT